MSHSPTDAPATPPGPDDLAERLNATWPRTPTIEDLGGWAAVGQQASALQDSALLPVVCRVAAACFPAESDPEYQRATASVGQLGAAVVATRSPASFVEAVTCWAGHASVLQALGRPFLAELLQLAAPPPVDADAGHVARAAAALQASVRARQSVPVAHWDLYDLLGSIETVQHPVYARAALRACLRCAMAWSDNDHLTTADVLSGATAPTSEAQSAWAAQIVTDSAVAIANLHMWAALRAGTAGDVLAHLENGRRRLLSAEMSERPDAVLVTGILDLFRSALQPSLTPLVDLDTLREAAREVEHFGQPWDEDERQPGVVQVAWARLSLSIGASRALLVRDSWYRPADEISRLVDVVLATGHRTVVTRDADGANLRQMVLPELGTGFARNAALRGHLRDHLAELERASELSPADQVELEVCQMLWEHANSVLPIMEPNAPKASAGAEARPSAPASPLSPTDELVRSLLDRTRSPRISLALSEALTTLLADLRHAPDFSQVEDAVTEVAWALLRFAERCLDSQRGDAAFLFSDSLDEDSFRESLTTYLHANDLLPRARQELPRVGGGRADLHLDYPGFTLITELKVDDQPTAADHAKYVRQAAAYQATSVTISFLVTFARLRPGTLNPHLRDVGRVIRIPDGAGRERTVVSLVVHGARRPPSRS